MSKKIINLTGRRFGRLLVFKFSKIVKNRTYWECVCTCGNKKEIDAGHLKSGDTKSCGCLQKEIISKIRTKHKGSKTSFYSIWLNMRRRCNEKTHNRYENYGGRGITYDSRWEEFLNFKKDMYFKYVYAKKKYRKEITKTNVLSIERRNVNGNYCFDNCEFIPRGQQTKNTRDKKTQKFFQSISPTGKIEINNNQTAFARKNNLQVSGINACLKGKIKKHKGWFFKYSNNIKEIN